MSEHTHPQAFPPASPDDWRARVERDLKGADFTETLVTKLIEGIELQPLVGEHSHPTAHDPAGLPGLPPFVRGSHADGTAQWDVRQSFAHPSPTVTAAEIKADLAGGVTSIHLVINDGTSPDGLRINTREDLETVLSPVQLSEVPVSLEAGQAAPRVAAAALSLGMQRGDLGLDPIGTLLRAGTLTQPLDEAIQQAAQLTAGLNAPGIRGPSIDTRLWHAAGASETLDLAIAASTGVAWLRALEHEGLTPAEANQRLGFRLSVGCDFLTGIAKLRALRWVWGRIMEECGAPAGPSHVHVFPAARGLTQRDPWVNILRTTVATFAGAVAGADSITATPWDQRLGLPDPASRRLARNTQLILALESHLSHALDPAGGSWAIEALTQQLAAQAWSLFQSLEAVGGTGTLAGIASARERLAPLAAERDRAVAHRTASIVGVNAFPNLDETPPTRTPAPPAPERPEDRPTASVTVPPLHARPLAAAWEGLRDASDTRLAAEGSRPRVFLACLGALREYKARATWVTNLLNAAGIESCGEEGNDSPESVTEAFTNSNVSQVIICATDQRLDAIGPATANALKQAGACRVLVAGRPRENQAELQAAGVDQFVFAGANVLDLVETILAAEGVTS